MFLPSRTFWPICPSYMQRLPRTMAPLDLPPGSWRTMMGLEHIGILKGEEYHARRKDGQIRTAQVAQGEKVISSEYPKVTVPNLLVCSLKWQFLHVPHFQTNSLGGLRSFRAECLPSDEKYSLHTQWVACDIPGEGSKVVSPRHNWKSLDYFFSLRCWNMFVIMDAGLSWHRRLYVLFVSFCIMFVHATNCISDVPNRRAISWNLCDRSFKDSIY
jgi:hypothetical protein